MKLTQLFILFSTLTFALNSQAAEKLPTAIGMHYQALKELTWSINLSKKGRPSTVWIAKKRKTKHLKDLAYTAKNITFHTTQKSAKRITEVLIYRSSDGSVDILGDLNQTGLITPVVKSSFRHLKNQKIPKPVNCENEALSILTEAGIDCYFCKVKGKIAIYYDETDIP